MAGTSSRQFISIIASSAFFILAVLLFPAGPRAEEKNLCDLQPPALEIAERIRGMKSTKAIPCEPRSRAEVADFLVDNVLKKMPKEKLKREGVIYKAIGLVPEPYDYEKGVIDLYSTQIGGYYDPDTGHFVMADWIPAEVQLGVAVHELTHALQDQRFKLNEVMDPLIPNGDEVLARAALVEGDASVVMVDHLTELSGVPTSTSKRNVDAVISAQLDAVNLSTGIDAAPRGINLIILFPYTEGLRFADLLWQKGGFAEIDKAFKRLPKSSEEILHPELYLQGGVSFQEFAPSDLLASEFDSPKSMRTAKPIYTDTIGEYPISVLLDELAGDSGGGPEAAKGWGGDLIGLFDISSEKNLIVHWRTKWDSEKDAREFFDLYKKGLIRRAKTKGDLNEWLKLSDKREVRLRRVKDEVFFAARVLREFLGG